ncbi:MAG: ferredoxin--NADP reductase [Candidatus Sumerlaeia bacterium]|nr:ferredoxin--NADP reductase [Candidatus Sumerlaeia bacterium]
MTLPELNAIVIRRVDLSSTLFYLRVAPVGWEMPEFRPGQFAVLGLPPDAPRSLTSAPEETAPPPNKLIRRAYSIASSSQARHFLEFFIVLVPDGALTPRLHALRTGDPLWLGPKITGMFTLEDLPEDVNVVLVATGTGLAPYMSMLRSHVSHHLWKRVAILHGARQSEELGYSDELFLLARHRQDFTYLPTISRPQNEHIPWQGHVGYVQSLWTEKALHQAWGFDPTPDDTHFYLCGNPTMVEQMLATLTADGFKEHSRQKPGQIHVEKYW